MISSGSDVDEELERLFRSRCSMVLESSNMGAWLDFLCSDIAGWGETEECLLR